MPNIVYLELNCFVFNSNICCDVICMPINEYECEIFMESFGVNYNNIVQSSCTSGSSSYAMQVKCDILLAKLPPLKPDISQFPRYRTGLPLGSPYLLT